MRSLRQLKEKVWINRASSHKNMCYTYLICYRNTLRRLKSYSQMPSLKRDQKHWTMMKPMLRFSKSGNINICQLLSRSKLILCRPLRLISRSTFRVTRPMDRVTWHLQWRSSRSRNNQWWQDRRMLCSQNLWPKRRLMRLKNLLKLRHRPF